MPVMSAVHVSESHSSRYSQSLLHSRSLRDLHHLPPNISDKSHHRILQLNNPRIDQDPCPPETGASQPSRCQPIKAVPDVQRRTTALFTQVSSAATASQARATESNHYTHHNVQFELATDVPLIANHGHPNIRPYTSPKGDQLRNAPVDSRKARRYGGAFGLERNRPSLPTMRRPSTSPVVPTVYTIPDNSSLASTPLAMYTEGETDSDSDSINHSLELSFPHPPPMDNHMRLRRMHSSPMFTQEGSDIAKAQCYVGFSQASIAVNSSPEYDQWDAGHLVNQTSPSLDYEKSTKHTRHTVTQIGIIGLSPMPHKWENPPSSTPIPTNGAFKKRATAMPTRRERSEGIPLTHTRSLSHFRKGPGPATPREPVQLPSELSISMDRLDLSIKKLKVHGPGEQPTEILATPSLPVFPTYSPPSLASAGRQKPMRRPHLSAPPPSKFHNIPPMPTNLGTHLRSTPQNQFTAERPLIESEQPPPKSFIDITPEQTQRISSREKMRKLLARASMSVLKTFRGKNGSR